VRLLCQISARFTIAHMGRAAYYGVEKPQPSGRRLIVTRHQRSRESLDQRLCLCPPQGLGDSFFWLDAATARSGMLRAVTSIINQKPCAQHDAFSKGAPMIQRKSRRKQPPNRPQSAPAGPASSLPGPAGPEGRLPASKRVRRPRFFPQLSAAETALTTLEAYQ
jgi:hypothetical protein